MTYEDQLRERLLERTRQDVTAMRGAVHRGELEAIARLAHRLVGAAGALELDALEAAARDLERVASAGDASASRASIEQLASLVGKGGIT